MKTQIMLDLETLGKRPGAVIRVIGAVKFDGNRVREEFCELIDVQSCIDVGLEMDADTVLWWMKQSEEAREEMVKPGGYLTAVLGRFSEWILDADAEVWGNGSAFDNALLAAAYHAASMPLPWKFWNDRCYRTIKALNPDVPCERVGTHHNALDDAKSQALHLIDIFNRRSVTR